MINFSYSKKVEYFEISNLHDGLKYFYDSPITIYQSNLSVMYGIDKIQYPIWIENMTNK